MPGMPAKRRRRHAGTSANPLVPQPLLSTFPDGQHRQTATDRALRLPEIVHAILMLAIADAGHLRWPATIHSDLAIQRLEYHSAVAKEKDQFLINGLLARLVENPSLRDWIPEMDRGPRIKINAIWPFAFVNRVWLNDALHLIWRRPTTQYGEPSLRSLFPPPNPNGERCMRAGSRLPVNLISRTATGEG